MKNRFALWLALVAMALNALAPLGALARSGELVAPICYAAGPESGGGGSSGLPLPGKRLHADCPLCAAPFALPTPPVAPLRADATLQVLAFPPAADVPRPAIVALAAPPRGPPPVLFPR